jgi:hypothetical protein
MPAASFGSWAMGTQTGALIYGGANAASTPISTTLSFDGTNWSVVNSLSTAAYQNAGGVGGTNTNAISVGGNTPSVTAATEEWTVAPAPSFQKENLGQVFYNSTSDAFKVTKDNSAVPLGTWASGGNLNTAQIEPTTFGSQTATISAGGQYPPPYSNQTESYNGSTWTIVNSMPTTRYGSGGAGTATAGLIFGNLLGTAPTNSTISWDGTNWSVDPATLNTGRGLLRGCGTQTAAFGVGGNTTVVTGATESYNGTVWTELNDLNTARYQTNTFGTQTAATAAGGYDGTAVTGVTEIWNGTSWTEVNDLNTARSKAGASANAIYTDGIVLVEKQL